MNSVSLQRLAPILPLVDKPARYIGGEFNTILKSPDQVDVRIALAFPDVYDIGMSYHGFKVLYELINEMPGVAAERVFAPWDDMEKQMRQAEIPLYTLESKTSVCEIDIVGFTLQHEMNYTNILNMLDLASIPQFSCKRNDSDPLIIAGGHGAFNPELMSDFIDAFVVGDGEWVFQQIIRVVRLWKKHESQMEDSKSEADVKDPISSDKPKKRQGVPTHKLDTPDQSQPWLRNFDAQATDRETLLLRLTEIPGIYVPRFYDCKHNDDGMLRSIVPNRDDVPSTIQKTNFDVTSTAGSIRPVVPLMRVVHDRLAIEIKRGCTVGCRFCQAGMITRPVRERDPQQIIDIAQQGIANTGYDEVSLLSLSSADYSEVLELTRALRRGLAHQNISVSLPSLRINAFDVDLAEEMNQMRKAGFTFAPEAGTARLRAVINKSVDEQRFRDTIETVLSKGWRTLKFYFMIGLPTETDEDLQGIIDLTEAAIQSGRRYCGKNFQLNVSLSPFVPKPHTPFQWHKQPTRSEFEDKIKYVESRVNRRFVTIRRHNIEESMLEGILSRGDRRLGRAVFRAWELGCKFDNWHEHLQFDRWQQAFADCGIDPEFYSSREREENETFPWDHIDSSLGRDFLWGEKIHSEQAHPTKDCSRNGCAGCEVCDFKEVKNLLAQRKSGEFYAPPEPPPPTKGSRDPVQRIRLAFTKLEGLRYISHLDMAKVVRLIFRRTDIPMAFTQGFNRQPKMHFTPPLPLGFASRYEILDVCLLEKVSTEDLLTRLSSIPLDGLSWTAAWEVPVHGEPSLSASLSTATYEIEFGGQVSSDQGVDITAQLKAFHEAESFEALIFGHKKNTRHDLKQSIKSLSINQVDGIVHATIQVSLIETVYVNPLLALEKVLGMTLGGVASTTRTGLEFTQKADPATPLG
ncbi:B12-binding domain-containing radical SAM protein [candidate division BRC1 bacterium HGW-BRC1-1]|jgi:radical SAM family uncharacterized protein/radical SAM-linked protein|nr:MAG: B12-binding domain-containing radical SAM protein [candidate division BRC1 bacterium HGW-BRC1-1]